MQFDLLPSTRSFHLSPANNPVLKVSQDVLESSARSLGTPVNDFLTSSSFMDTAPAGVEVCPLAPVAGSSVLRLDWQPSFFSPAATFLAQAYPSLSLQIPPAEPYDDGSVSLHTGTALLSLLVPALLTLCLN